MTSLIRIEINSPVAEIILNKPAKRNALCQSMWQALPGLIHDATSRDEVCVVIIHGGDAGAFAAGADISEFSDVYATPEKASQSSDNLARAVDAVENCPKPVIAAIDGACVGGGVSIACACDLRFAGHGSKFGVTPGKLGLLYSPADTRRLIEVVGTSNAKDLLFSGRIISTEEAVRMQLIDHLGEKGEALNMARQWAEQVSLTAQSSVRASKEMIRGLRSGWNDHSPEGIKLFLDALLGPDFREGFQAFLAKRPPQFPGNAPSKSGG